MMCKLTQKTLCSCKLPKVASCQQNCLSSEELRRKRSQRKRQMRNRVLHTTKRDILSMNMWGLKCCPPSFNKQSITMTGNVLITLLLLPCNLIMVTKHFWWGLILQVRGAKLLLLLKGMVETMKNWNSIKRRSSFCIWFSLYTIFLFVLGFQCGIKSKLKNVGMFRQLALEELIPPLHKLQDRCLEEMELLHWRCWSFEDCNLRLDSNQPEFLWYGMRAASLHTSL